ncbi:MAG: hypothetical protein ACD_51C00017G0007 [uncultured bacterium]|nr:MAG: hypothetical protein ACD_51C00017G0007 [uncultured bacterium]OGJ47235.1 MAG: adenylosuccinate lyase [Candidatus Peregrinibacteria bacterium RIFOXYA2_FULL_41_18]OGJ49695.1 MAG: adenylosuccinate lyase [Candidatus Peregrinibacteria bacterium RIFOXYB12_FULL_41_12]OGJ53281.1 MAG: adenylosuccinate lyase [Candidatus Peregrinibacteria bacterium RIFOXYC2_FULL_41_22]OGJ55322.1 MAG: adenylosuccinate lyase [Candidatus Peregrinibacteria bacterium RIFOXYB2_FULL_41_88]
MLTAISPLDGRYARKLDPLREYFSEAALIRARIYVECTWLMFLCNDAKLKGTRKITKKEEAILNSFWKDWDEKALSFYMRAKEIEKVTNHDVKSIEYLMKEEMKKTSLKDLLEFVHFACTSEDITNLSYAVLLKKSLEEVFLPKLHGLNKNLIDLSKKFQNIPMMAHTHGQPASPTTVGKELKVFVRRLERQIIQLKTQPHFGKINGATGNYNAHMAAYPEVDWVHVSEGMAEKLGLTANLHTTQIESHDYLAEIFHNIIRINTILIDLDRDIWSYISKHYFKQKVIAGEVGSSTMPHKVNPIDFENSEGNLGIANAVLSFMAEKLPTSRMQRDLTDSTVLRNMGVGIGHSYLAYDSTMKGLSKLEINTPAIDADLNDNWEVLAEPIQTVMRKYKVEGAYEKLKALTRGKKLNQKAFHKFIDTLKIPEKDKKSLKKLTPRTYIGLADKL